MKEGKQPALEISGPQIGYFDVQAYVGTTKHMGGLDTTKELIEMCRIGANSYVLDVGCGVGATACYLAKKLGCHVVGVDNHPGMIARSKDRAREVAVSGSGVDLSRAQEASLTVQDERWCLIDRPDPAGRELYDKSVDRAEVDDVIADHPQEAERLHRAALDFLAAHEAHPAWLRWFVSGDKGDLSDYRHHDPYLDAYMPYFVLAMDQERHL